MSANYRSVQRPQRHVKPAKRPRGPQAVTFLFTLLQPITYAFLSTLKESPMKAAYRKHPYPYPDAAASAPSPLPSPPPPQLENIFIDALVQACSCRRHMCVPPVQTLLSRPSHLYHKPRRRYHNSKGSIRLLHQNAAAPHPPSSRSALSREEYLSMLDWYREPFSTQAACIDSEPFRPPSDSPASWLTDSTPGIPQLVPDIDKKPAARQLPLPPLKPLVPSELSRLSESSGLASLSRSPKSLESLDSVEPQEQSPPPSDVQTSQAEPRAVTYLYELLNLRDCTHKAAFEAYSAVPSPGVSYLSEEGIRLLFRQLSTVEKKDEDSMLRYLSVVDDMKSADLPMTEAEWNSAIAFCGLCFARIRAADVESALRTWKEMEEEAAVKSGNVTFNILFDMAAKAGKFVLAEMILKEMESRKLSINRYARVGFIYYHGLRADGDAVRRTYREFVEAGEIVDTVVLNCVIASLIRAGEPAAAEQVYERMKRTLAKYTGERLPSFCWRRTRDLGRALDRAARNFRHDPSKLQAVRDEQLLAPDLQTYAIFVENHASRTGELRRIITLLTEMQYFGLPMHGRIFLKIFKGFAFHGGIRYTIWTKARLESVWSALLAALDESDVKIMKWMVIWTVRAFERCAGRERTLEVWGELRRRWKPKHSGELEMVMGILRDVLDGDRK